MPDTTPIFLHAFFRSGSTYVHSVFERADSAYYCLQEPLHEWVWAARHDPERLEAFGASSQIETRHPLLRHPYFHSLHAIWDRVNPHLEARAIYADYFNPSPEQPAVAYWKALIENASTRGCPVIQECRSSGRIGVAKQQLGGQHLYLLRNPWDQWWSMQINSYFNAAIQMIAAAEQPPRSLLAIRERLSLRAPKEEDLQRQVVSLQDALLSAQSSYLLFYTLWCLAFREARQHADLLVDMDELSTSGRNQQDLAGLLADRGITGLDFSDCRLPVGLYGQQDRAFFVPLEMEAHRYLKADGWSASDFLAIEEARARHETRLRENAATPDTIWEQHERWRAIAIRHQNHAAEVLRSVSEQSFDRQQIPVASTSAAPPA